MTKTIAIVGYGPAISASVARTFGAEGYQVALIARNAENLAVAAQELQSAGITAAAFAADAGDPAALRRALAQARATLGPLTVLHWNAFGGQALGDPLTAAPEAIHSVFDIGVVGLLGAVQEALSDLKASGEGAVLVTNGAFADLNPQTDEYAVQSGSAGVALANAAKHKLVGLLAQRLRAEGVYVGEVMVAGTVKGTAWEHAHSIEPSAVAQKFWELYRARSEVRARIGG